MKEEKEERDKRESLLKEERRMKILGIIHDLHANAVKSEELVSLYNVNGSYTIFLFV